MSQNDKEPKHLRVIAEPEEKGWTTEEEGIWENKNVIDQSIENCLISWRKRGIDLQKICWSILEKNTDRYSEKQANVINKAIIGVKKKEKVIRERKYVEHTTSIKLIRF